MAKRTVVIGASPDSSRYSFMAVTSLKRHGHEVFAVGLKQGIVEGLSIQTDKPAIPEVDTVTLYVGPANQPAWYDYILSLNPKRVIFNPGTENETLYAMLREKNIEPVIACTLVMLSIGNF